MKKFLVISILLVFNSCEQERKPLPLTMQYIKKEVGLLLNDVDAMLIACQDNNAAKIQEKFRDARLHYKHAEALIEFYFPPTADLLNGPAIDETEEYDDKINFATGFQVIEEHLFPEVDHNSKDEIIKEIKIISASIMGLQRSFERIELTDENVIESARLELFRIMSLGISGFDSPIAAHSLPEAKASLEGVERILSYFNNKSSKNSKRSFNDLRVLFDQAKEYLDSHQDFNSFDRADFIVTILDPLCNAVYSFQKSINVPNNQYITAIDLEKSSFFDADIFSDTHFAPNYHKQSSRKSIELGQLLFFDPILSGNNRRSCASCHNPSMAFTDGRAKSLAFDFRGEIDRNSPTLLNAGYQKNQFYDSRVVYLEDQITDVLANKRELHGNINDAAEKLGKSKEYVSLFRSAFNDHDPLNNKNVQLSLASYIRSLKSLNSSFDRYMRGDKSAMNADELKGFNLFMGKGKCGTCHFMPLFNGSVPPSYSKSESEILGVPDKPDTANAKLDRDVGKFNTYKRDLHKNAFKTPTVRNAALTAPYLHNGVFATLEEVLDFYNRGGGAGIGIELDNQTLPPDKLNLSKQEQKEIIAFIHALTDTTGLTKTPKHLPLFDNKETDERKVGGWY